MLAYEVSIVVWVLTALDQRSNHPGLFIHSKAAFVALKYHYYHNEMAEGVFGVLHVVVVSER